MKIKYFITVIITLFFSINNSYAQMEFVENKGQWDSKVKYRAELGSGAVFLEEDGFTVNLLNPKDLQDFGLLNHGPIGSDDNSLKNSEVKTKGIRSHAYKVSFLGANFASNIISEKPFDTYYNYYLQNDPSKWASNCKIYQAVTYQNIYPNIDLRYYSNGGNIKYDLIVKPGGNPSQILMKYKGVDDISVKNKELVINTTIGYVKELYPYTYQSSFGKSQEVECKYVVEDDVVRFKIKNYDVNETLVIDPSLIFSTFTGSRADNWGYTATPGPTGNFFAGGIAFGAGYPNTIGPGFAGGQYDMAIFQFSANGSARIYGTYIGGSGNAAARIGNDQPHSLIAKSDGSLIIAGRSNADNFPQTLNNSSQTGVKGGYDIVVIKLNPNGSLAASVKIGGSNDDGVNINEKGVGNPSSTVATDVIRRNYGDDARSEVILDPAGNIYVASCTKSTNYPVLNAVQNTFGGGRQDGVIIKINPDITNVLYNTYFGGSGDDACFVLSVNPITSNLYVAGGTSSTNLLGDKTGVLQPTYQGGETDGFITCLTPNGSSIIKTTYQGLSGAADIVYGIQFDKNGFVYTMGTTTGSSWPVINANFSVTGSKQFITKIRPDLSAYVYSTVFGSPNSLHPNISPTAFLVDRCENVYVSGWGGFQNSGSGYNSSGTVNMPILNQLPGLDPPDGSDFYFIVIERNAQSLLFGSYFGQNRNDNVNDHVDGGTSRFDANGIIYQGVCADCLNKSRRFRFPVTSGSWSTNNGSTIASECNQAAIKIEMNFAGVGANIKTSINNIPDAISGCSPLKLVVFDSLSKAKTFFWNWGDGSKIDTLFNRSDTNHIYNLPVGVSERYFTIMLIAEDSGTCNIRDTAFKRIKVSTNFATLDLSFAKQAPCENLTFQFTNKSNAVVGSFDQKGFVWDFGDGKKDTGSITYNPIHTYASPGTYKVKLCVIDTFVCNSPDCRDTTLIIASNVRADFRPTTPVCVGRPVTFSNRSSGGQTFKWEFGDTQESTSNALSVTHIYDNPGIYKVRLIANNPNTCNLSDTSEYQRVTVISKPIAFATWGVQPPQVNTKTIFTNQSSNGAVRYLWNFGDGESSTDVSPTHQYNETNNFNVQLIAYNAAGCTDTFPLTVSALINPLLDVPNAFTPGKFGTNGIIKVVGFGIKKMNWKIYNRWGQLVFKTENINQGWDGTFKGSLQAMDVYTYTLEAELAENKKVRKTGDISLLR